MIACVLRESRAPRPPNVQMKCRAYVVAAVRATCPPFLRMQNDPVLIADVAKSEGKVPHLCDVALLGAEPLRDVQRLAVGLCGSCSRRQHRLRLRTLWQELRNWGKALPVLPLLVSYRATNRALRRDNCTRTFSINTCCC